MPINYKNYNPGFKALSKWVRFERAKGCCEGCGVGGYHVIEYLDGCVETVHPFTTYKEGAAFRQAFNKKHLRIDDGGRWAVLIVLTVAHLDHDTRNDDLANLKALCQKCHLSFDRRDNWQRRKYGWSGKFSGQLKLEL